MKKTTIAALAALLLCASCGGKQEKQADLQERVFQLTADEKTGISRMQPSTSEGDVRMGDATYHYRIERTPCDSLKKVKDEQGNLFTDNLINFKITRQGGKAILNKRLTKHAFDRFVGADFMAHAILEGLVFDKEEAGKLLFAASICYPQSDLYYPFRVIVSPNGNVHIEPFEDLLPPEIGMPDLDEYEKV